MFATCFRSSTLASSFALLCSLSGVASAQTPEPAPNPEPDASPELALDCSKLLGDGAPLEPQLAELAAHELEKAGSFHPGPLGEALISEIVGQICSGPEIEAALSATCGVPRAADARELRSRLVLDTVRLVTEHARTLVSSKGYSTEVGETAVLGVALKVLLHGATPMELARELAASAPDALRQDCSLDAQATGIARNWQIAAVLIAELQAVEPTTPDSELRSIALNVLLVTGARPSPNLSSVQEAALVALRDDLVRARALAAKPLDAAGYGQLTAALAGAAAHSLTVAFDRPVPVPLRAAAVATALAQGDVDGAIRVAAEQMLGVDAGAAARALSFGIRVARARSEEEAKAMLARTALGLGPWADRFVAALNLGVPVLESDDFKVSGDAKLGYNAEAWGVLGRCFLNYYDLTSDVLLVDNLLGGGSAEGWYTFNAQGSVKVELRADVGASLYSTTSIPLNNPAANVISDEDSVMVRGSALAGLRLESSSAALGFWLGAGAESETYNELTVDANNNPSIQDASTGHLMLTGRLRAQFPLVTDVLVGRVRVDALRHAITRESVELDIGDRVTTTTTAESSDQLELGSRAYVDLELARFFGFVPAVEGGVDYVSLADATGTVSTVVPVFGIGIRRTEF
jgi:hypothetical protein